MSSNKCAIVNYGTGNIGSIVNILNKVGASPTVINDPRELVKSDRIILPGVGSFDNAMSIINTDDWLPALTNFSLSGRPIMGICLGMQIMMNKSEEGVLPGLGWIDGEVHSFKNHEYSPPLRIPHMGWNVANIQKTNLLFDPLEDEERFYFIHSYYASCNNQSDVLTTTPYKHDFVSSFQKDNILGFQFHPEKSHKFGIQLFRRFIEDFKP